MGKALVDMPDELHKNLRRRAIDEGISLKVLWLLVCRSVGYSHPMGKRQGDSCHPLSFKRRERQEILPAASLPLDRRRRWIYFYL